jgi:hypothetical protein
MEHKDVSKLMLQTIRPTIPSAPSITASMLMLHHLAAHRSISLSSACACTRRKADEMASRLNISALENCTFFCSCMLDHIDYSCIELLAVCLTKVYYYLASAYVMLLL